MNILKVYTARRATATLRAKAKFDRAD